MTLSRSIHSYTREVAAFERAEASDKGIRIPFSSGGSAHAFTCRLNNCRRLYRKENLSLGESHPMYGRSAWDVFSCSTRRDDEQWWVYIERHQEIDGIEELP